MVKSNFLKKVGHSVLEFFNFHPIFACEVSKYMFFGVLNPFLAIEIDLEQYSGPCWGVGS